MEIKWYKYTIKVLVIRQEGETNTWLKRGDMLVRQGGVLAGYALVEYRQSVTHINQFPIAIKKDLDTVFQDEVIDRLVNELDIGRRETKTLLSYLHNVETVVRYNLCYTLVIQYLTGHFIKALNHTITQ